MWMQIEDTVRAIQEAEAERRSRHREPRRRRAPIAQLDAIIEDLETMHLRDGIRVSVAMIERIEQFLDSIPEDCRHDFPLRTTITRVMDNLYEVQDCLLTRKDGHREQLRWVDEALDGGDYSAA